MDKETKSTPVESAEPQVVTTDVPATDVATDGKKVVAQEEKDQANSS